MDDDGPAEAERGSEAGLQQALLNPPGDVFTGRDSGRDDFTREGALEDPARHLTGLGEGNDLRLNPADAKVGDEVLAGDEPRGVGLADRFDELLVAGVRQAVGRRQPRRCVDGDALRIAHLDELPQLAGG